MQPRASPVPLSRTWPKVRTAQTICESFVLNYGRGIPLGFLNTLEARLIETEMALIAVIQQSDNPGQLSNQSVTIPMPETRPHSSQQKTELSNEWTQFPLQSMEEILQWYRWKTATPHGEGNHRRRRPRRLSAADAREAEAPAISQQSRPPHQTFSTGQNNAQHSSQDEDDVAADSGDIQDLLQARPSIYF